MWDYAAFNQRNPVKRWGHNAVVSGDNMFVWGGHTNGSQGACCAYDWRVCGATDPLEILTRDPDCGSAPRLPRPPRARPARAACC
jgi:hypothetical protein